MKNIKITLLFFALILATTNWAQIITSSPAFVTQDGGAIDIIFDASLGTGGLNNYMGTDVYAHTGVITSLSTSGSDWKHAPAWLDNSAKYKLSSLGNNKWKLSITPNLKDYYGLATGEIVKKIAFVFRNGTGTLQGKDTGGADIFLDVYQSGLNVAFTNPTRNQSVSTGTTINFQVASSLTSNISLLLNGTSVKTATSATTLSYSYTFTTTGDYTFIAQASLSGVIVADTIKVSVPNPVINQARPAGLKDGINYIDNTTATLILYAPNKSNVFVIGDFNNWSQLNAYQLKKDGNYWWIALTGLTPGKLYGFQYLVDGTLKVSDPYTELVQDPWNDKWINQYYNIYPNIPVYPEGKTDGLVATLQTAKTAYNWQIPAFTIPSKDNMIIYELLLRDFTKEKSLEAAISKLDYLKNLGITAVELMPIQEFDGNNSWGYNPNHYFAPDKAYGSPDMYKKFIDECHKRGMAVILDMVFNQASGLCPFAELYWDATNSRPAANNPWMNVVAPHPYSVLNDFNHSFSGTKDYFKRVLQYWMTEYKVDGYRMDLTKGFTQNATTGEPAVSNYDQSRVDNLTEYYNAVKTVKNDAMFILEHFCGADEENALAGKGMYLWRNVNYAYSQSASGYQTNSDFSSINTNPRQWVGYAESHDEERNFYNAKISGLGTIASDSIYRTSRVPLNIAFTTLTPGPKMIYEFGEMGYDYSINSLGGRTNPKPSAWDWLNLAHRKSASDACSKIMSLRKLYQNAFTNGTFALNIATADWNSGRRIALSHTDLNMVVLGNFNASATITAYPNFSKTGTWYNLLTGETLNVTNTSMTMSMLPGELIIYTDIVINLPNALNSITQKNCYIYPSVTNSKVYIYNSSEVKHVVVYNLQGILVKFTQNNSEIDLTNLSPGIYIIEINTTAGKSIQKVIKK
jgi:1,4-alpha-glucan branching enzyme/plastocyanin